MSYARPDVGQAAMSATARPSAGRQPRRETNIDTPVHDTRVRTKRIRLRRPDTTEIRYGYPATKPAAVQTVSKQINDVRGIRYLPSVLRNRVFVRT